LSACIEICQSPANPQDAVICRIPSRGRHFNRLEISQKNLYVRPMIATSYRDIVQRAGVRSGHPVIEGTRIGVHDVVAMTKTGASVDEVVASFPRLTRAQVYECLAYYEDHRNELEPLVAAQISHLDE